MEVDRGFRWGLNWFYFTLGINLALPLLPTKTILMDELRCSPSTMAFVMSWINLPWGVKPVYGFISDSFPIRGYRRTPYLCLGLLANAMSWLALSYIGASLGLYHVFFWLFMSSLSLVVADAAIDSLLVDCVQLESTANLGELQSGVWISRSVGSLLSASAAGIAMDHYGMSSETMFAIAAVFALSGLFAVQVVREVPDYSPKQRPLVVFKTRLADLVRFWSTDCIWRTCGFVLLFSASPTSGDVIFYFMRTTLGFSLSFLGVLTVAGHASYIIGSWLYRDYLRKLSFRTLMKGTIWVAFGVGMTTVIVVKRWNKMFYIPDHAFVLGDTIFLAVCAQIAFMPVIVLAAKMAPPGAEGTIYNSVISVSNLGSVFSEFSGGVLTNLLDVREDNFTNLWLLILICNLTTLLPLPFLWMLPEIRELLEHETLVPTETTFSSDNELDDFIDPMIQTELSPLFHDNKLNL
uniref:Major facilitator superfamily (MFS) profile domain-containing protein n=1 Tax=Spongospora subterranea TaxID=70186 RepID=A0A0H5R753_9EUKA|eukprot:CRZ09582.1 hypothetical protein [Spongospora subterranea]